MKGQRVLLLFLPSLLAACACPLPPVRTVAISESALPADVAASWRALAAGQTAEGQALLAKAGDHPAARFGRHALAFEGGRDAEALNESLALLAGDPGDALAGLLVDASAARLRDLVDVVVDPRPFEERLLAQPRATLPWRARLALEEAVDFVARRRGDGALLAARPAMAGCLTELRELGLAGRLSRVDLDAGFVTRGEGTPVSASGCRLWLAPRDGWPGVRVLRGRLPASSEPRLLVLDVDGPARVTLTAGGESQHIQHQSEAIHGPRARAIAVAPSRRTVELEVRVGGFGNPLELRLFVLPAAAGRPTPQASADPALGPLLELASLLAADGAGETDAALVAAEALAQRRRFAPGLAAAAAFVASEPTRPEALGQAESDGLYRRAVTVAPGFARALRALALSELGHGRGSEAAGFAEQALKAQPAFWPAAVTLADAQRSRGLERQSDLAIDAALQALGAQKGACPLLQAAFDRARTRNRVADEQALLTRVAACDARFSPEVEWRLGRGEVAKARAALERRASTAIDRTAFGSEAAALDLAAGDAPAAARRLRELVAARLRDPTLRVRVADALAAAGQGQEAHAVLAETARYFPADQAVAKIARLEGLPLPMQDFHKDARAVIDDYKAALAKSKTDYAAPAVLVLDRTVMRVLADGTQLVLTHNIVNVKTKDGIARWGEIQVPAGAEILALRTHKADGSTREPEEISGKETVSAPDLAPGDFVEWETLEADPPADAFAPGFIGDRFYFQSVELPLHLSELVLVVPPQLRLELDSRAGAPAASESRARDGARIVSFSARQMPQLFAERAAVSPLEWIPSVRASAGLTAAGYVRNVRDGVFGLFRSSPALRAEAQRIAATVPAGETRALAAAQPRALAAAIVRRVVTGIEAEANLYEAATATLARGRGNRAALIIALARELGLDAQLAFVRPLDTAPADGPIVAQQIEDFSEVLVRFRDPKGNRWYVEPSLEHAAFGYLTPRLDGARALLIGSGGSEIARGASADPDGRDVNVKLRLDDEGQAAGEVIETLRGWPAIEWANFAKQTADDPAKRRQEFEQRWMGQQFPGARLLGLAIDIDPKRPGEARLRYGIAGLPLGNGQGDVGRIPPSFFRVAAGRRYANLKTRRTDLQIGPEVPIRLVARITLPAGTKVSDAGRSGKVEQGPLRFSEERRVLGKVLPETDGAGPTVEIIRSARLPLLRVTPADYEKLAPALRRMDALERTEIQFTGAAAPAQVK